MFFLRTSLAILMITAGYNTVAAMELLERAQIERNCADLLFLEKFDELEAVITRYRDDKARTSSGSWKLTICYAGLQDAPTSRKTHNAKRWKRNYELIDRWFAHKPDSDIARLVKAGFMIEESRELERGRPASGSRKAAPQVAVRKMMQARDYLIEVKPHTVHDPHWYKLMAETGLYSGAARNEFFELLEEGLERYPQYISLYYTALKYTAAYWPYDRELVEAIANTAVMHTQATEGMSFYTRVYWMAYQTHPEGLIMLRDTARWDQMKQGIDEVLAKYPADWNRQNFAFFACIVEDPHKAKQLLDDMVSAPIRAAWHHPEGYNMCVESVEFLLQNERLSGQDNEPGSRNAGSGDGVRRNTPLSRHLRGQEL